MTVLLGRKGDKEPCTCGVCGRMAGTYGSMPDGKGPIMWLCDDVTCLPVSNKVYNMKPKELCRYETVAVHEAAKKVLDPLFEVILTALWEKGIKNLDDLDGDAFKNVCASILAGGSIDRTMTDFLAAYGASIKEQTTNNDPPF